MVARVHLVEVFSKSPAVQLREPTRKPGCPRCVYISICSCSFLSGKTNPPARPHACFPPLVCPTGRAGTHGPPPEMQLSLASLAAPKLGRAPGIADEQFAWDSREFLRKKCIGKQVGQGVCCLA